MINIFVYNYHKSSSVNLPKVFCLVGWFLTNSLATLIKESLSTISGLDCRIERLFNLFWLIVERSQVLSLRIIENDRSGAAEVAPFVKTNRMRITTFFIRFSDDKERISSTISPKFIGLHELKITGSNSSSQGSDE